MFQEANLKNFGKKLKSLETLVVDDYQRMQDYLSDNHVLKVFKVKISDESAISQHLLDWNPQGAEVTKISCNCHRELKVDIKVEKSQTKGYKRIVFNEVEDFEEDQISRISKYQCRKFDTQNMSFEFIDIESGKSIEISV